MNETEELRRDVRTLLLYKIHSRHHAEYEKICAPDKDHGDKQNYFTVGSFDALSTYRLFSLDDSINADWIETLSEDKKTIFKSITANVSYHPVHIVANIDGTDRPKTTLDRFWSPETAVQFPFLIVTFVYGAAHSSDKSYEDQLWCDLSKVANNQKCCFVVYNSVNLCDLVILWRTNDIADTLRLSMAITDNNAARKTYSFVNIPLAKGNMTPEAETLLQEQGEFPICIHGSICDSEKFYQDVKKPLIDDKQGAIHGANCQISFGENDFLINAQIGGPQFYSLLKYFLEKSEQVDAACWNIYTEFQQPYLDPSKILEFPSSKDNQTGDKKLLPQDILSNEYRQYLKTYKNMHDQQYPWADAFLELTNIHAHIDKLPILHGPSYLVWGCLNVANQYFCGDIKDYPRGEKLDIMLKKSQLSIEHFVRAWNQLTDQITKVDDVIFHRLGTTTAIYNTLSESLLELYHLFLSEISGALIDSDGRSPEEKAHSFLLSPTLSQEMRISEMFSITPTRQSEKQVYIIEFPLDYLYKPRKFVVQLAHECLHIFGQEIRLRDTRLKLMVGFIVSEIISTFEDLTDPTNLTVVLNEIFIGAMQGFQDDSDRFYMANAINNIKRILKEQILTGNTYRALCQSASALDYSIHDFTAIERWSQLARNLERKGTHENEVFFDEKVDACAYFFKECYADVMAIKLIHFSLDAYLQSFSVDPVVTESPDEPMAVQFIQRLAIVITAGMKKGVLKKEEDKKVTIADIQRSLDEAPFGQVLGSYIFDCFSILYEEEQTSLKEWPPHESQAYFSIYALRRVIKYLELTLDKAAAKDSKFESVRNLYRKVIYRGDFFGDEYYKRIMSYHREIAECVKNSEAAR